MWHLVVAREQQKVVPLAVVVLKAGRDALQRRCHVVGLPLRTEGRDRGGEVGGKAEEGSWGWGEGEDGGGGGSGSGGYGGGAEAGRQSQTWRQRPCIQVGVFLRSQSLVFMRPAMTFCSPRVS